MLGGNKAMAIALLQEERGGRASVKSNPLPDPIVAAIWRRASPMRSFFLLLAITTTSRDSYCIFFFLFFVVDLTKVTKWSVIASSASFSSFLQLKMFAVSMPGSASRLSQRRMSNNYTIIPVWSAWALPRCPTLTVFLFLLFRTTHNWHVPSARP